MCCFKIFSQNSKSGFIYAFLENASMSTPALQPHSESRILALRPMDSPNRAWRCFSQRSAARAPSPSTSKSCAPSYARAWRYLALSSTKTRRLPRERCLSSVLRKPKKDSRLNGDSNAVTSLPVRVLTAPKHATDLCVGACSNTGSLCSGGIHLRQRVPGC